MQRRRISMKWSEVREHFPNTIVLVEAIKSETIGNERVIDEMAVIDNFENGNAAWKVYKKLHAENHSRELYIFHTNNEKIKVIEQPYIGVRRQMQLKQLIKKSEKWIVYKEGLQVLQSHLVE